jgi:hypothetical protein
MIKLHCIKSTTEIFTKEPFLVLKAYESGYNFEEFVIAIRDADPELALAGIEFWQRFIMIDTVIFKEDFKMKLLIRYLIFLIQNVYQIGFYLQCLNSVN